MSFARIEQGELVIGRPVPWPLYDEHNTLLLAKGVVLRSQRQLDQLVQRGLFRKIKIHEDKPGSASKEDEEAARRAAEAQQKEDVRPLDQVKINIGDTVQLQSLATDGKGARYYVKLVGYLKNKSVMVTTPVANGSALLMREGQSFVVRLFSGKSVYAFTAHILRSVNAPYPYLHLTYPSMVRGMIVRRGARASVSIICSISNDYGENFAGMISNLSTGGAHLICKEAVCEKDDEIWVKFRLDIGTVEQIVNVRAIVRSLNLINEIEGKEGQIGHGLQFIDVQTQDHIALSAFVYQTLYEAAE